MKRPPPVVVGGATLDILGGPAAGRNLVLETSNPGEVHQRFGGVARNVAECMSRLGSRPVLLSAVGADIAGDGLVQHMQSVGMDTQGIQRCEGMRTATYAALFDGSGDLVTAVADMDIIDEVVSLSFRCCPPVDDTDALIADKPTVSGSSGQV